MWAQNSGRIDNFYLLSALSYIYNTYFYWQLGIPKAFACVCSNKKRKPTFNSIHAETEAPKVDGRFVAQIKQSKYLR